MIEIVDQPPPAPNDNPSVHDLVIADMGQRKTLGLQRYGTLLQAHNGRDALVDAYQEALDLACYLRQAIAERDDDPDALTAQELVTAELTDDEDAR